MKRRKITKSGARDRLRAHFLVNLGRVMDSDELGEASGGISEWARRVRELRNEEGFQILTHNDDAALKPGQYVLRDATIVPAFARSISKETRALVLDRNGFTCQMCGAVAGEPHPDGSGRKTRLHIGHIVDKSLGGSVLLSRIQQRLIRGVTVTIFEALRSRPQMPCADPPVRPSSQTRRESAPTRDACAHRFRGTPPCQSCIRA